MKMKKALFIDYGNVKQLTWWSKEGSKKCKSKHLNYLVSKDTGKAVGEFVKLSGLFASKMLKKGTAFHEDPIETVIEVKN